MVPFGDSSGSDSWDYLSGTRDKMKKVVILLSGGLDSAVTAYIARKDVGVKGELYALNISYGQTHFREITSAQNIANELGASLKRMHVPLDWLVESSLTGLGEIPTEEVEDIPSTWVPQRNSIFLALAFAYAETVGADLVYTGFNVKDYSGYPDCRPEFVEQIQKALNLASKQFVETGKGIGIACPIMHKTKAEIIEIGRTLGVDFSKTWSCYQGGKKACGVCPSCRIRLAAFEEVGVDDPVEYE